MSRSIGKRTPIQTPARNYTRINPPPTEPVPSHGPSQKQSKIDRLAQRQDIMYNLAGQVGRMGPQFSEQNSIDYTYEQSFREAQRRAEDYYEEQMQNLENDKINLIKRLNLALVELDRITQDRTELGGKVRERVKISEDLQRRLEKSENFSGVVANNLKGDIAYQKEQNEKLRGDLADLEKENDGLTGDVAGQTNAVDRCKEDAEMHHARLKMAEENLRKLQDMHNACVMELKTMVEQAENLVRREKEGEENKNSVKATLDGLVKERSDLIFRMNNLTEKYEQYVKEMTKEREDTIAANKNRTKLLTASSLFSQLVKRRNQRLSIATERMKRMAGYHKCLIKCAEELGKWQDDYMNKLMGLAFRRWWHNELVWTKERHINDVLLQKEHARKQRAMLFSEWQKNFRELDRKRDTQFEATQRILELNVLQEDKRLRRAFDNWYQKAMNESRRDKLLHISLLRMLRKDKAEAFLRWMALTMHNKESLKAQRLANEVAMEQFKRQMFARFRHNLYLEEDGKVADAQVNLEEKYGAKRKKEFMKACTILFMRSNKKRNQQAKEEAFQSMKFNTLTEKRDRTHNELDRENPEIEIVEKSLKKTVEDQKDKHKHDILVAALLGFRRKLHYYFERWRTLIPLEIKNAATVKRVLNHFGTFKIAAAFHKWLRNTHRMKQNDKQNEIASHEEHANNLKDAILELSKNIDQQNKHVETYTLSKLQRIAHIIARRFMHHRIMQWRDAVRILRNVAKGGRRLARTLRRHKLLNAFNKYRQGKNQKKYKEGSQNKTDAIKALCDRNTMKTVFKEFRGQVRLIKTLKNQLRKVLRDKDKDKPKRMLNKWRRITHNVIRETAQQENENTAANNDHIEKAIEENETIKKHFNEDIKDIEKHEDKQAALALFKNFIVWYNTRLLDAFRRWRGNNNHSKVLKSLVIRYLFKNEHNNCRAAFANWRAATFALHHKAINDELKARIGKYNTFTRLSTLKLGETSEELKELKETYTQIKGQDATDQRKIETSTQILDRLQRFCIKFPHDQNYFLAWIEMVNREKELQGRAKLITQMYVGKHIYAKLKQVSQQSMAKNKTLKKWERALKLIEKSWMRKGFKGMKYGKSVVDVAAKSAEIQGQDNYLENTKNDLEYIKENARMKNEKEVLRRRLLKSFWAWQRQSAFQKLLKKKALQLSDAVRFVKLSGSMARWRADTSFIEADTEKGNKGGAYHDRNSLKKALRGWYDQYIKEVTLPKVLAKVAKRQIMNNAGHALEELQIELKDKYQEEDKKKDIASLRLGNLLARALTNTLSSAFSRIIDTTQARQLNNSALRRIFLKLLMRKLQDSFNLWRIKAEERGLIDHTELRGFSAKAASELALKRDATRDFLQQRNLQRVHDNASIIKLLPIDAESLINEQKPRGPTDYYKKSLTYHSPGKTFDDMNESIANPKEDNKVSWTAKRLHIFENKNNAMKWLLLQWQRKIRGKDNVGKYLYMWRRWLYTKKNVEESANLLVRRLSFGDKAWAFDRLRNMQRAGIKEFEKVPRTSLINTISATGLNVAKLKEEAKDLGDRISEAQYNNENLAKKYESGRNLCVTVLAVWSKKPLRNALLKWKLNTQKARIADLENMLQDKLNSLKRLEEIHDGLEGQNNQLISENEDLRQASIDGLEIANTIQRMTQEREQLSTDLTDRSLTVKRLLEENVSLQNRMDKAKEENENLMKLSKQVI